MASSADQEGAREGDKPEPGAATTTPDASAAASSTANDTDAKSSGSLLDAVKAAAAEGKSGESSTSEDGIEGKDESGEGSDPEGKKAAKPEGEGQKAEGEDELPDEVTEEELRRYKPKTRRRIEKLLDQVSSLSAEREQFKTSHEQLAGLHSYMRDAGLSTEEVNTGFDLMRLMKTDPVKAFETLKPYFDSLQQITGQVLPDDLRQQVATGQITEAHAAELSSLRSRDHLSRQASDRAAEAANRRTREQQVQTTVKEVAGAVSEWERQWSGSDPDYRKKSARVKEKIELAVMRDGMPKSKDAAVALAEKCRKAVEDELKPFLARRQEIKSTPEAGSVSSTPKPTTMLEAVRLGAAMGA